LWCTWKELAAHCFAAVQWLRTSELGNSRTIWSTYPIISDFNQFEIKPKIYTYFGFLALQQLKKIISFSVISF
jgi:hypothetical protein